MSAAFAPEAASANLAVAKSAARLWKRGLATVVLALVVGGAALWGYCRTELHRAREAVRSGALERAELHASRVLAWTSWPEAYILRARSHWRRGALRPAFGDLLSAKEGGWPVELCELERLLLMAASGQFGHVEPALRAVCDSNAEYDVEVCATLARGYARCYRLLDAHHALDRWIARAPNNPEARLLRGEVQLRLAKPVEVYKRDFDEAVRLDPASARARLLAGQAALRAGDSEAADEHFRECLERTADCAEAAAGRAHLAIDSGRLDDAARFVAAGLANSPDSVELLFEKARLCAERNEFAAAVAAIEKTLEKDRIHLPALHLLGFVQRRAGRPQDAARTNERIVAAKKTDGEIERLQNRALAAPKDPAVARELAAFLERIGRQTEANAWKKLAAELAGDARK